MRVTVVAAQWHGRIMGGLVAGALRAVEEAGAQASVVRAVGSFEPPVLAGLVAAGGSLGGSRGGPRARACPAAVPWRPADGGGGQ